MSKPFNSRLHDDIMKLKNYTGKTTDGVYRRMFKTVMQKHNISRTTVYKELSKTVPGTYRRYENRGRAVPIGLKEANMVKDMLSRAKTTEEIRDTMSIELGFSYSIRRLNKVKELIQQGALLEGVRSYDTYSSPFNLSENESESDQTPKSPQTEINIDESPAISHKTNAEVNIDEIKTSAELSVAVKKLAGDSTPGKVNGDFVVSFKGNLRKLFYRLSMLSKMDPNRAIKLNIYGYEREANPRTVKSCLDQLAASVSSGGMDTDENIRFNIQTILLNESNDYKRGFYISPTDIRSLEQARRSLVAAQAASGGAGAQCAGGYALDDVLDAVNYFSPGTSREELMNYIKMKNMRSIQSDAL